MLNWTIVPPTSSSRPLIHMVHGSQESDLWFSHSCCYGFALYYYTRSSVLITFNAQQLNCHAWVVFPSQQLGSLRSNTTLTNPIATGDRTSECADNGCQPRVWRRRKCDQCLNSRESLVALPRYEWDTNTTTLWDHIADCGRWCAALSLRRALLE